MEPAAAEPDASATVHVESAPKAFIKKRTAAFREIKLTSLCAYGIFALQLYAGKGLPAFSSP